MPGPYARGSRRGAILIIVIGLASILLAVTIAFMVRMSSDARSMNGAISHAQARIMLTAALMYLQETSRVGWGDATGECFGWTDVRDGGLGPRGPRPAGASGDPGSIPAPAWWSIHTNWPVYKPFPNENTADFPPLSLRVGCWPLPGTTVRCPMGVAVMPPYAVQTTFAYNPVPTPVPYLSTNWNQNFTNVGGGWGSASRVQWPLGWLNSIFNVSAGAKGLCDPQPVSFTWLGFAQGTTQPGGNTQDWGAEVDDINGVQVPNSLLSLQMKDGTENRAWFRIYREMQGDHDDILHATNNLWWNRVALFDPNDPNPADQNWSVFIVTCGAGGTRGYRFWDDSDITTWETSHQFVSGTGRCIEPVTASESGIFVSKDQFESLLLQSQILWYRCEWSALQSGARDGDVYDDPMWAVNMHTTNQPIANGWWNTPHLYYDAQYADTWATNSGNNNADLRSISTKTVGGNFKWMQRLDHDPIKW